MARHIAKAGFEVQGLDTDAAAQAAAKDAGIKLSSSAAAMARKADFVIVVVGFDKEAEAVILGDDGLAKGGHPGLVVGVASTVAPATMKKLQAGCTGTGILLMDMPLTRGEWAADAAQLLVMAGGDAATFERCKPVMRCFSDAIFHVGDLGAGQVGKPASEHVYCDAPAIIEADVFERVQAQLKARNPHIVASRVVTGPILLTGLAVCGTCGGGMTLRTGTSRTGDVYRYYTCTTQARAGKSACRGRSIRMDRLDGLVTRHLADKLLQPQRMAEMLSVLTERRAEKAAVLDSRGDTLQREVADADQRLRRLYRLVEEGLARSSPGRKADCIVISAC